MIPIIIPAYKNQQQLDKCIDHLRNQTLDTEVYIRNNTHDNIYFTAAVNEGLLHFLDEDCQYIIILNQDMYLQPTAVSEMIKFMDSHPLCGIGTPLQLHPQDSEYVICAGTYEAFPAGRHQHGPISQFTQDEQIPWANGACMILRKKMIREIGLLDKNLHFIGSDSDYSFTARSRGWQVWRISAARGTHEHGASGVTSDTKINELKLDDMIYFSDKWLTGRLYKALSYEGKNLTPEVINNMMTQYDQAKATLKNQRQPTH